MSAVVSLLGCSALFKPVWAGTVEPIRPSELDLLMHSLGAEEHKLGDEGHQLGSFRTEARKVLYIAKNTFSAA